MRSTEERMPCLAGAIGTNGRTIPVLDFRHRLGLNAKTIPTSACVLVIEMASECPMKRVGILADKLSEVVEFRASEIRGSTAQQRIEGRPYGRPKTLLEPEQLLRPGEWTKLRSAVL
jgi:chemotaxis signal transduction protein